MSYALNEGFNLRYVTLHEWLEAKKYAIEYASSTNSVRTIRV